MNTANKILILLFLLSLLKESQAQEWWENAYDYKALDINRISIPVNNVGGIDYRYSWSYWDYNSVKRTMVFDQGLWIIGKINEQIHLAHKQWSGSYSPGPIINNNAAMNVFPEDSLKYRVYKIELNDTSVPGYDYSEWPAHLGAPVSEYGNPVIYNNQTLWTVYNGLDSSLSIRNWWNNLPVFPIEVHSLAYGYPGGPVDWLKDVVFFEWQIINKGTETIDSTYFGFWTDIDINMWTNNYPAVDSSIQLGYCWTPDDSGYFIPMSVGYVWKYGPAVDSPGDTAIYRGTIKTDYKNLDLTSFHGIADDAEVGPITSPARSTLDAWNMARGFDADGNVIIDPTNGFPTKFPFNGDPVTNTGFIFPSAGGSGAGFVMFSGPVNLAPQDTQWVMAALIVSSGTDYRDAIVNLRLKAETIQVLPYDELVTKYSVKPSLVNPPLKFSLSQNFPNPFNNGTKILFELPYKSHVTISIYDILGGKVSIIANNEFPGGQNEVTFFGNQFASGIYFYEIKAGSFIQTKKMVLIK